MPAPSRPPSSGNLLLLSDIQPMQPRVHIRSRVRGKSPWHRLPAFSLRSRGASLGDEVVGDGSEDDAVEVVDPRRKKAWEASLGGEMAAAATRGRAGGRPSLGPAGPAVARRRPRRLVMRLARDTWRGLDSLIDREHQLPIDHVHLGERPAATSASVITRTSPRSASAWRPSSRRTSSASSSRPRPRTGCAPSSPPLERRSRRTTASSSTTTTRPLARAQRATSSRSWTPRG